MVAPSVTPWTSEVEPVDVRYLCVMSMEILALSSRGMPVPDPQHDEVRYNIICTNDFVFITFILVIIYVLKCLIFSKHTFIQVLDFWVILYNFDGYLRARRNK